MFISSMTGFARKNGSYSAGNNVYSWTWEIKSVNGKSLDFKVRLPYWMDGLSLELKSRAGEKLNRGTVNAALDIVTQSDGKEVKINEILMNRLAEKAIELYEAGMGKLQKPSATDILNMKGVVELEESKLDEEGQTKLEAALLSSFVDVCELLKEDRLAEGTKMKEILLGLLEKIGDNIQKAENIVQGLPEILKEKLKEQIAVLLDGGDTVSEDRLAQEVVILVNRSDIREELDRLHAHIKTAEEMLNEGGAVGRRLDFLCQELNRETNTLCSKSSDIELTNRGMELKALIEQFREQVQNIE